MCRRLRGESSFWVRGDARLTVDAGAVERVMARAGLAGGPKDLHEYAFVDRQSEAHIPYPGAEKLAKAFAAAEPDTVTLEAERYEEEMLASDYETGERFHHDLLRRDRPMLAIARQWAGFETEVARLNRELERVRGLLREAIKDLELAGVRTRRRSWRSASTRGTRQAGRRAAAHRRQRR